MAAMVRGGAIEPHWMADGERAVRFSLEPQADPEPDRSGDVVHGTNDVHATFAATMKAVETVTRVGKAYDLVVPPGQRHAPTGVSRDYWFQRMREFFVEQLQP